MKVNRVGAARAGGRRAAERAGAVAVVDELHAGRQRGAADRQRGGGNPLVVTVNDPAAPIANVVLAALVIAGAWWTFSVKLCVVVPELFVAVKVMA